MSKIDQYNLLATSQFPVSGTEEISENLQLIASPTSEEGVITGTVTSGGQPLADATVKVYNTSDVPIAHATTGAQGQYTISSVVKGTYKVTAAKSGYLTPSTTSVTVAANRPTTVDIALTVDPDSSLNTLFGIIRQAVALTPIEDATVNVYQVVSGTRTLVSTTNTNSSGQYIAPGLSSGTYVVNVNKVGYFQSESQPATLTSANLQPLDLTMIVNSVTNNGTVSGIITDKSTSLPIANATVALYSVIGLTETIVQLTKTNAGGRYLFGNVQAGNYIVKAFSQKNSES